MSLIQDDFRWKTLQARIDHDIPDEKWILRQLDAGVRPILGQPCVQVIVEREMPDRTGDQVLGVGSTEDAAILDAIRHARQYPPPRA